MVLSVYDKKQNKDIAIHWYKGRSTPWQQKVPYLVTYIYIPVIHIKILNCRMFELLCYFVVIHNTLREINMIYLDSFEGFISLLLDLNHIN